jgi:hypothetical protein
MSSLLSQSGIEEMCGEVDRSVEDRNEEHRNHDEVLHEKKISILDRTEKEASDARKGEDTLNYDRADEQSADLEPEYRRERGEGVAPAMAKQRP